ncbi:diacylglycerol acyltransferase [Grosmannia clavigera kw1407]|uniref:Diacylglycerol O-acyltransferase n=1 Tax=Grosmannia clavigera (strain kw1407 / UAMH 11150) TaxID=655863 RepID=F0XD96_GROCL|nr:diacylglycerol acyltransferase [Grosmannia clavigera kw1407]EFX04705.1 diacylglycerol acyltransferase [Grosmannia clavigera kw1407]
MSTASIIEPKAATATNGTQPKTSTDADGPAKSPKVRFAPLRVPLRRRKQTLAVLIHCTSIMVSLPLFFFCCAVPLAWPLLIPYMLHLLFSTAATDGRLHWRSEWFRSLPLWRWFGAYFPAQLHKTADLAAERKYIFGYHPHGIISHGAWASFATEGLGFAAKFPGITNSLLTLESNFSIPFYREYLLLAGIRSVSRQSIVNHLSRGGPDGHGAGRAVTIVVGGARESLQANPGTMRLVLHGRYGFIKVAMATGADLVPVLGFGEVDLYQQLQGDAHPLLHRFQLYVLKAWKFTLPFMRGRGIFNYDYGLMPYRVPLNVVVGRPIAVDKATPGALDPAEVERLHGLYVAELQHLWDEHKDVYAKDRVEEMQILA